MARVVANAAPHSKRTSNASGLLNLNINAATGVNAMAVAATSPAPADAQRRTVAYRTATAATPSRAWGTRMLHEERPKMRADISITQRAAGGLSTVMKFDESDEPKKNAFQLLVPACTAAE